MAERIPMPRDGYAKPLQRAPSFAVIARQPLQPFAVVSALLITVCVLSGIGYALSHVRQVRRTLGLARTSTAQDAAGDDDKDDPSQVDTVVLGDAADAPEPQRRRGHAGSVHPTILIRLPRFGPQMGLIPDTTAGHRLFAWLAAFNQSSAEAMRSVLPTAVESATDQMLLRQQTGGFLLLSAKEVEPGLIVFRLRDQTPLGAEAVGTLLVRPGSNPPTVLSFSLRQVPTTP